MLPRRSIAPLLCLLALATVEATVPVSVDFPPEQLEFFERRIRPLLAGNCYSCHSHGAEELKGDLYLDSRAALIESGVVEPGDPDASILIEAIRYENPAAEMPPKGRLPDEAIADLERWVTMGLPWPEERAPVEGGFDLEARRASHWAWHPPVPTEPLPVVDGLPADANPIDRFIEARLAREGLVPAPEADRATLLRRVTLDLTGLPPTPAELADFARDLSPGAYERVVDRLLASPRYGEKWARHWLDLVRYAESYGHEFDYTIPEAWKYRDYVIRAIEDDLPYDRFVTEHLAGDLIPPRIHPDTGVNEAVKGTGWWYLHEQTHGPTDVRHHEAERIDNQLDVLSKTFLGVTVACARCHDHKFDAISDEDYYSLAGYLQSSRQQLAYLDPRGRVATALAPVQALLAEGQRALDALALPAPAPPEDPPTPEDAPPEPPTSRRFAGFDDGTWGEWRTTGWAWGSAPTTDGEWDATSGAAVAHPAGLAHSGRLGEAAVGTLRSPEFDYDARQVWLRVKGKGHARLILDGYTMARFNGLLFEGLRTDIDTGGEWRWISLAAQRDFYHGRGDHRAHLELIDDHADAHLVLDEVRFGGAEAPPASPLPTPAALPPEKAAALSEVFALLSERFRAAAAAVPPPERALAITDGTPEESYVHLRGSWHGHGETTPRRMLTALGGATDPPPSAQGSGRDTLAARIVDPANPLTARVQVNRLWHHLFGRGLVETVDNFGLLGRPPSHPALLDHLALTFQGTDRWSTKAMVRRIVTSRAYRRTSDKLDPRAEERAPENRLLHRQSIRRMTAETLRDAILSVSGSLDERRFGPPVGVHLTEYMQGRGRPGQGPLDGEGRRTIYTSVRRNFLSPLLLTFDTPIPFSTVGRRNVTTVPAQSLALMNDPFIHEQVERWAERHCTAAESEAGAARAASPDGGTDPAVAVDARIELLFLEAVGRPPTAEERAIARGYITEESESLGLTGTALLRDPRPWRALGHALLNTKGFLYIR